MRCRMRGCGASRRRSIRCVSRGDGGIGDAAGIAALAECAGARGADALALSPLHALFGADPSRFGPYSPSTRLFLNPLHASPALVLGEAYVAAAVARQWAGRDLRTAGGRAADRLAGRGARQASAAACAVRARSSTARSHCTSDFARFRADGGELLTQHAVFEALHADAGSRLAPAIGAIGRRICAIPPARRSRCSRRRTTTRCCSTASCNGSPIARSRIAQAARSRRRHAHRADRRSGGRHGPDRQPCVEPAGRRARRPFDRRAAGSVQSARPGLGADRILAARARWPAGSRRSLRRCARRCATPAACASTMRWG